MYVYSLCSNLRGCQGLKIQSKVLLRTESPAGAVLERLGSAGSHSIVRPGAPTKSKLGVWHNPARIQFVKDWNFVAFVYIYSFIHLIYLVGQLILTALSASQSFNYVQSCLGFPSMEKNHVRPLVASVAWSVRRWLMLWKTFRIYMKQTGLMFSSIKLSWHCAI